MTFIEKLFSADGLFADSTSQRLSQACGALHAPARLAATAQTLDGSCSNFSAHAIEKLCLEPEQLGRAKRAEEARPLIDALEHEYFRGAHRAGSLLRE